MCSLLMSKVRCSTRLLFVFLFRDVLPDVGDFLRGQLSEKLHLMQAKWDELKSRADSKQAL